jgi:periplasmic protein TonB
VKPQIKFVPPVVTEKEEPKNQEVIPPEIPKNVEIATQTVKGDTAAKYVAKVEAPPPPPPPVEKEVEKPVVEQIFTIVEQNPEFPDGQKAMFSWLSSNIKYPPIARENGIEGTVYVGFVVNTDGSIVDVIVKRGIGGGCNEEAVRVVQQMPNWKPGRQQGRPVRVAFTLPIKFKLE